MTLNILGIGGSLHDYSCCLLNDGEIVVAIEEERLSREKNSMGKRSMLLQSIDYCLHAGKITLGDVDMIVSNDLFRFASTSQFSMANNVIRVNHHMAHAAGAFYTSGFAESAVLIVDGSGSQYHNDEVEVMTLGYADMFGIKVRERICCEIIHVDYSDIGFGNWHIPPKSIGGFYTTMTYITGFGLLQEGKLMGLAPYGTNKYVNEFYKYLKTDDKLIVSFGMHEREFLDFVTNEMKNCSADEVFRVKADLAFATQLVFEDCLFQILNKLYSQTNCSKLCFGGGVALNSVFNEKITKNTRFKEVFVFPAAGDGGTSIGAALYAYHEILKQPYVPGNSIKHVYWGAKYSYDDINEALGKFSNKINYQICDEDTLLEKTANQIQKGKIIGWFQGGSEIGPRALGNRSIIADPRNHEMKDILNARVKFRESFRPFAPAIMLEHANDYFEMTHSEVPFMLFVSNVRPEKQSLIPSVTHVDGTGRLQTVSQENNRKFHELLNRFYKLTDVPVLLNTSFNIKGKPIVETPHDAIYTFLQTDIDYLIIDNYFIEKIK